MLENVFLSFLIGPLGAFILTLAVIPFARKFAIAKGFVDAPGGRKAHKGDIPPIGGLVIFPVFIVCAVVMGVNLAYLWPLFAAILLLIITGAIDDRREINAWVKFGIQFIAAALVVIPGGAQLQEFGNIFGFGNVDFGVFTIPFTVCCVALLINAINLMDGIDGLAGGKSFVVLGWFVFVSLMGGDWGGVLIIGTMLGALLGFLYYNMRHPLRERACIFLGDSGSMALGLVLAYFCISLSQPPDPVLIPVSGAWIVALPIMDACGQFARRLREKRNPFSPDRGHFHHHFLHAGFSVGHSTAAILLLGAALGAIGYVGILIGVPEYVLMYLWIALFFKHLYISQKPEKYVDILKKFNRSS